MDAFSLLMRLSVFCASAASSQNDDDSESFSSFDISSCTPETSKMPSQRFEV